MTLQRGGVHCAEALVRARDEMLKALLVNVAALSEASPWIVRLVTCLGVFRAWNWT
jgi:hypothetical protein